LAKTNSETLNLVAVTDEFDVDTFVENVDTEKHIEKDDEIARSESNEETRQPSVDTPPDAAVDLCGEGNEANVSTSVVTLCDVPTSSRIDCGSYYIDEELRSLKLKHISLQNYLNHKNISHIGSIVCDSAVVYDEVNPRVREEVIKKGQLFESLDVVQLILQDYVVRHHRPYYVAKSNKDVWYIISARF
jgi:hypothetical protein